jgi:mono/diheme cytochrome c family protein
MRAVSALAILLALAGCANDRHAIARQIIADHCGACHLVPGVAKAAGRVGPSLAGIARQQVLAGRLPNSRANMLRWITKAQAVEPGNVMPDIPLTRRQANAVADYLYTLD